MLVQDSVTANGGEQKPAGRAFVASSSRSGTAIEEGKQTKTFPEEIVAGGTGARKKLYEGLSPQAEHAQTFQPQQRGGRSNHLSHLEP